MHAASIVLEGKLGYKFNVFVDVCVFVRLHAGMNVCVGVYGGWLACLPATPSPIIYMS